MHYIWKYLLKKKKNFFHYDLISTTIPNSPYLVPKASSFLSGDIATAANPAIDSITFVNLSSYLRYKNGKVN